MLAVRLFSRIPVGSTSIKSGASCLRLLAGVTSGGSALAVVWKHYRIHAAKRPKVDSNQLSSIVREVERKTVSTEKFDWKLFWHYLRPQIWIIACATAVKSFSHLILFLN